MAVIVHLSDVHLLSGASIQDTTLDSLVEALATVKHAQLLVMTGDLFDSVTLDRVTALEAFEGLLGRVRGALDRHDLPTVILPGNHDRRRTGTFGPHDPTLFNALGARWNGVDGVRVLGLNTPVLADLVPHAHHGLDLRLVSYDSTWLPRGFISSGGIICTEDLLSVAAQLAAGDDLDATVDRTAADDWPLVLLVHHHLIPTPVTDLAPVDAPGNGRLARWLLHQVGGLIANADREELTMTALGAGTALSMLHTLGRAVVVLHRHKHVPVVRLLSATHEAHGDVLLAAAGSAGLAQPWGDASRGRRQVVRPSFNVITVEATRLQVETVAYAEDKPGCVAPPRRLVDVSRQGARWTAQAGVAPARSAGVSFALNAARVELTRSVGQASTRWDLRVSRELRPGPVALTEPYHEPVDALPGVWPRDVRINGVLQATQPGQGPLTVAHDGVTDYVLDGGVCRTVEAAVTAYGPGKAHEWVGLLNRFPAGLARLALRPPTDVPWKPFGSTTDVTTGTESPAMLTREPGTGDWVLAVADCPPLTLLRIYWLLEDGALVDSA